MLAARLILAAAVVSLVSHRAAADPLPVKSGKVVLPITGLAIDLPKDKRKTATWALSGSWSLSADGGTFDGRDVVDQKLGDKLVAGNWIHVGYFDAGDCATVVKELDVPDRWTLTRPLYGQPFELAGGTYDLGDPLGKVPAVALCAGAKDGARLLLYHFFLDGKPPKPGAPTAAALAKDKLLASVTKAWKTGATGPVQTTHHPEIRQRGDVAATRTVTLPHANLTVALPDDGFVWLVRKDAEADFLDRMAPGSPDLTVEVAKVPGMTCDDLAKAVTLPTKAEPPPSGVPAGWTVMATLIVDKALERLVCRQIGDDLLAVGLMGSPPTDPQSRDFGPLAPLLAALATAAGATP